MAAAEERMYQRFRLPDSLLVLDVDPGVAAARKPDHDAAVILEKSRVAGTLARLAGTGAVRGHRIDATRPFANVLLDVKTELWDAI
jgi:hypothetical protein